MEIIDEVRTKWKYLREINPLFVKSLPPLIKRAGLPLDNNLVKLNNEITILRTEVKLNSSKLEYFEESLEQLEDATSAKNLDKSACQLLDTFEDLIVNDVLRAEENNQQSGNNKCTKLPKIQILRLKLQESATEPERYINFPTDKKGIVSCRAIIQQFGKTVLQVFKEEYGRFKNESRIRIFNEKEIDVLRSASSFAVLHTTLFNHIKMPRCGRSHIARIYLCELQSDRLKASFDTCQERQCISATFARFSKKGTLSPTTLVEAHLSVRDLIYLHQITCVTFHKITLREHPIAVSNPIARYSAAKSKFPEPLPSDEVPISSSKSFGRKHWQTLSYCLAFALFQLYGTPWITTSFSRENIYLNPGQGRLYERKPYVRFQVAQANDRLDISEYIAKFGILVLELQMDRLAKPDDYDDDDDDSREYDTGEKSYKIRLMRILEKWKDDVSDDCRFVGYACVDFELLVESVEHPKISSGLKNLAVIYRCILEPLLQILKTNFGQDGDLFQNIPGPWRYPPFASQIASDITMRDLFDDIDATKDSKASYAERFLEALNPFKNGISSLKELPITLLRGPFRNRQKIRIAVLDSGIDDQDKVIKRAIREKKIVGRKSWVGNSDNNQDIHGHGTHVVRLLVSTAPWAEIYVARVCERQRISVDEMPRIALAIDWALNEWKVDIISLSLGFKEVYNPIEAAIQRALDKKCLIFAAASNNGGLDLRTRPANDPRVMCIHACDGLGNNGDMSPSPLPNLRNFTTLGVSIASMWKKEGRRQEVWKSGTSFATPIAAGFASGILEIAQNFCNLSEHSQSLLKSSHGIGAIFSAMSTERQGYDVVHPKWLWGNKTTAEAVATKIEEILGG